MNKTWLIIQREYLSRVRKKTFILSTILTPLLFAGLIVAVVFITVKNVRTEKVAVMDPEGIFKNTLEGSKSVSYDFRNDVDTSNFINKGYSGVLIAPHTSINKGNNFLLITEKSLSRTSNSRIDRDISQAMENNLISRELKIDPKLIDSIKSKADLVKVEQVKKSQLGKGTANNFNVASAIGYLTAFLIYITLFIYGVMVMRGVMEEKTNRIAEVMVSSVKPFQLMLGKIFGIGAVGLTQFLIWIVLITTFSMIAMSMIPSEVLQQVKDAQGQMPGNGQQVSESMQMLATTTTNFLHSTGHCWWVALSFISWVVICSMRLCLLL
jgi:ABC-2 type transport system permease protein